MTYLQLRYICSAVGLHFARKMHLCQGFITKQGL